MSVELNEKLFCNEKQPILIMIISQEKIIVIKKKTQHNFFQFFLQNKRAQNN